MDLISIGNFISEERKSKNLTQAQLAKILYVSEKTISKWECGKGFPDTSLILPLCKELNISANELLSGKRINSKDYKEQAENNLVELVKERKASKTKLAVTILTALITLIPSFTILLLAGFLDISDSLRIWLIIIAFVVIVIGVIICCFLDNDFGSFECRNCGHKFVPNLGAYIMGMHTITTRHLKCPKCGKRTWCKKRLTK